MLSGSRVCVVLLLAATLGSAVCVTFSGVCLSANRRVLLCVVFIRGLQRRQVLSWSARKPPLGLSRLPSPEVSAGLSGVTRG